MKKKMAFTGALLLLLCLFSGCAGQGGAGQSAPAESQSAPSEPGPSSAGEEEDTTMPTQLAEPLRLAPFATGAQSPAAFVIETEEALNGFYQEFVDVYGLDGPVMGQESPFVAAMNALPEGYFEENTLIVAFAETQSGAQQLSLAGLSRTESGLTVQMQRSDSGMISTAAMGYFGYFIEGEPGDKGAPAAVQLTEA